MSELEVCHDLEDFLPEWQRNFIDFPCYKYLEQVFWEWVHSDKSNNEEIRMRLKHARDVFLDLCTTDPEGITEKKASDDKKIRIEKQRNLDELHKKYIENLKK